MRGEIELDVIKKMHTKATVSYQVEGGPTGHLDHVGEALDADGYVLLLFDVLHGIRRCGGREERGREVKWGRGAQKK